MITLNMYVDVNNDIYKQIVVFVCNREFSCSS